jgi:hypothetical protein
LFVLAALGALATVVIAVAPAGAARTQAVRCVGTSDYCGASLGIAGRAANRVVTVNLSATNLRVVGAYAVPGGARRFSITNGTYRLGGSQYRFTLNTLRSNPRGARLVLLFGPASAASPPLRGKPPGDWRGATAIFNVGTGMTVSILGGGGGTSNCTTAETNTTFTTTKDEGETHGFGFDSVGGAPWESCFREASWSDFRFTLKDPSGAQVGTGVMTLQQSDPTGGYYVDCRARIQSSEKNWRGINCHRIGAPGDKVILIERIY